MERGVAIKKLEKLLGKKMGWCVRPTYSTADERAAAKAALPSAREERNRLKEQKDARHRAILEADAEYQSLLTASKAAAENVERLDGITRHHKITVGINLGWAFKVKAEGDSWEEVIEKLATAKVAA